MNTTKIEWADMTWNPVTGCYHNCPYCYARRIAERFGSSVALSFADGYNDTYFQGGARLHELNATAWAFGEGKVTRKCPFPYKFEPTMHRYRLDEPQGVKAGKTIFVCSMADLFGAWVPDGWIEEVFAACRKAPQHRYLFLTKNPARYLELGKAGKLPEEPNFWYGETITGPDGQFFFSEKHNTFVSIEPLLERFNGNATDGFKFDGAPRWIIMGAMTGPGSEEHQPEKVWVDEIAAVAKEAGVAVLMKDSLLPVVGEENMLREFPWDKNGAR